MHTSLKLSGLGIVALLGLAACGGGNSASSGSSSSTVASTQSTVNFVVTDTPSTAITVLSFQLQIASAVLQPGNVSLLPKPVTVDLAQLVSDTGFLASTVIDSGTFTSLEISYTNPQVTIQNNTAGTLTLAGQSCLAGAVCTFAPVLNNANVTISNGVFPLTLTASSSTGINLDLSIPDLLQSDLSVTFANGSSVNLSLLGSGPARIDDVLGTVTSVSASQVHLTTAFGDSLVLDEASTSLYNYPSSVCASASAACVTTGQTVAVDASLGGDGSFVIDSLGYLGPSGASLAKALVLGSSSSSDTAQLLLRRNVNASSLTPGEIATVTLSPTATYSVATASYPSVSGASFAGIQDLLPGQEVIVDVGSDLVAGAAPTFTTSAVFLQSSQVIGDVATVESATSALTIDSLTGLFTDSGLHLQSLGVQADASTTLVGFANLSAIVPGQLIAAKGPLLNVAGGMPVVAAVQLAARQ
jgi:hypothetical protein